MSPPPTSPPSTRSRRFPLRWLIVIAALILLVLVLLPSHGPVRELDGPSISRNLNAVIKAAIVYASDHNDHFPPHLAILVLTNQISPHKLIDPHRRNPYQFASLPSESDWPNFAPILDAHSDIIYVGADLTNDMLDSDIVAAYTKPLFDYPDARDIGFADGHIEFVRDPDLPAIFAASNAARAKLGLPPVTLDGPAPLPPSTRPAQSP